MQREIYNLFADNKPLFKGTRIKTTQGGIHTGGDHELSDDLLKSANRMVNGYVPFWVLSWRDLHADLIIPENAGGMARELAAQESESPTKQNG